MDTQDQMNGLTNMVLAIAMKLKIPPKDLIKYSTDRKARLEYLEQLAKESLETLIKDRKTK